MASIGIRVTPNEIFYSIVDEESLDEKRYVYENNVLRTIFNFR